MKRKKWTIVNLVIWSVVALTLIIVLLIGVGGRLSGRLFGFSRWGQSGNISGYRYPNADKYQRGGGEIDGSQVRDLEINWLDGTITVEVYDGDTVTFTETSSRNLTEEKQLHYYNDNGRLILQYAKAGSNIAMGNWNLNKKLTVKLPQKTAAAMGYVEVDTVSSFTRVSGISADEVSFDSTSGDFEVTDVQAFAFSIDSTSGNLKGKRLNVAGTLEGDTTSGDVVVEGSVNRVEFDSVSGRLDVVSDLCPVEVDASTTSGSVFLTIPDNDGFTCQIDTVSGKINSDFDLVREKGRSVYQNGNAQFELDSVSGDLNIKKLK